MNERQGGAVSEGRGMGGFGLLENERRRRRGGLVPSVWGRGPHVEEDRKMQKGPNRETSLNTKEGKRMY